MNGFLQSTAEPLRLSAMIGGMLTNYLRTFGSCVRLLRQDLNLTQKDFAERLRGHGVFVRNTWISELENSTENRFPSVEVLIAFAKELGTTTDFLLLLSDDPNGTGPVYFSPEADEAGKLIDTMTPKWRAKALAAIQGVAEQERDYQQNERLIRQLMASIEAKQGREALEEIIRQFGAKIRADSI